MVFDSTVGVQLGVVPVLRLARWEPTGPDVALDLLRCEWAGRPSAL